MTSTPAIEKAKEHLDPATHKLVAYTYGEMLFKQRMSEVRHHAVKVGNGQKQSDAAIVDGQYVRDDEGKATAKITEGKGDEAREVEITVKSWQQWEDELLANRAALETEVAERGLETRVEDAIKEFQTSEEKRIAEALANPRPPQ